ncbi:MAG TPA: hypothetical protein VLM37_03840, partial [Fibrobacteraceae bacterium]|nr:hypothetical protein [Fibrobacteraceae bacterium]
IVSTDSKELLPKADDLGVEIPFLRPPSLSKRGVRLDEVVRFTLEELESQGYFPDIVLSLAVTHPFRPRSLFDRMIEHLCGRGLDRVVAGFPEFRPCWVEKEEDMVRVDDFMALRDERKPVNIGLMGMGSASFADVIRKGQGIGKKVGIYEVSKALSTVEIRSAKDIPLFDALLAVEKECGQ